MELVAELDGVKTMTIAILNPDVPVETYHTPALGVVSKSALDQIARSPAHYRAWLETDRTPTPAMVFGSLTHQYVFELGKCLGSVAVQPDFGDCRATKNKEARNDWRLANEGKQHVSQEDWDTVRAIGDSVRLHPIAAKLIDQCQPEVSVFWQDGETGLDCKARVDGWVPSLRMALDLKTTSDASPTEFAKSVHNFRYHCQDAHYRAGLAEATGADVKAFVFIAVEKEAPYAVATYTLDDAAYFRGLELVRRDMATMKQCVDEDNWPAFGTQTKSISLPSWSFK